MPEYIDKDYVIDEINRIGANAFNSYSDYSNLFDFVNKATPTDVAPVIHAKWIACDDGWGGVYYDCSYCGDSWTTLDGTPLDNGMNYCPRCGSKMDKE